MKNLVVCLMITMIASTFVGCGCGKDKEKKELTVKEQLAELLMQEQNDPCGTLARVKAQLDGPMDKVATEKMLRVVYDACLLRCTEATEELLKNKIVRKEFQVTLHTREVPGGHAMTLSGGVRPYTSPDAEPAVPTGKVDAKPEAPQTTPVKPSMLPVQPPATLLPASPAPSDSAHRSVSQVVFGSDSTANDSTLAWDQTPSQPAPR